MTHGSLAGTLLSGYFADADLLVEREVATPADIDTAMRLGAGYPLGPFEVRRADPGASPMAAQSADENSSWTTVAVLGAGQMASGIAEGIARAGHSVTVLGRTAASVDRAASAVSANLARSVSRGRITNTEAGDIADRVAYSTHSDDVASVDLLIEAVSEDLDLKRRVLSQADGDFDARTVFATNTSSFRVAEVMGGITSGREALAIHFFNPAAVMKLVEVVPGSGGDGVAADAWVRSIGKTPVRSRDERGFIVNRLLIPYLNDAVRLHESGTPITRIDEVMTQEVGLPMGPFALIDLIGVDVTVAALDSMSEGVDGRLSPADTLRELVAQGRLGRKSGSGFYPEGDVR
jgi:3-hydroxybutyryl-CoA dehydrogenase